MRFCNIVSVLCGCLRHWKIQFVVSLCIHQWMVDLSCACAYATERLCVACARAERVSERLPLLYSHVFVVCACAYVTQRLLSRGRDYIRHCKLVAAVCTCLRYCKLVSVAYVTERLYLSVVCTCIRHWMIFFLSRGRKYVTRSRFCGVYVDAYAALRFCHIYIYRYVDERLFLVGCTCMSWKAFLCRAGVHTSPKRCPLRVHASLWVVCVSVRAYTRLYVMMSLSKCTCNLPCGSHWCGLKRSRRNKAKRLCVKT